MVVDWDLFYSFFSLSDYDSQAYRGTPLSLILLDWQLVCKSRRLLTNTSHAWSTPIEGAVKLNFDGHALGTPKKLGIGGLIRDHEGLVIKVYSKLVGDFATETELATLLKGLEQANLSLYYFVVKKGTLLLLSNGLLKRKEVHADDSLLCQIFYIFTELGCIIRWVPHLANQVANGVT